MIWLLWKTVSAPVRLALGSLKFTLAVVKAIGPSRVVFLAAGAGVALLVAPTRGAELREKLRARWNAARAELGQKAPLAERVRTELMANVATWKIPTPEVTAEGARIVLRGRVADRASADTLVEVAASVKGVAAVDDQLLVDA